jgi:hypothetical protein
MEEARDLVPQGEIEKEKLDDLREDAKDAKTYIRVSKDEKVFKIGGEEGESIEQLKGVIVDFFPNWSRYDEDTDQFEKVFEREKPEEGDGWKRRCDVVMITPDLGEIILDLSTSGYRHGLGKYHRLVYETYGLQFKDVMTIAKVVDAKSRKFGKFNTVRFELGGFREQGFSSPMIEAPDQDDASEFNPPPPTEDDIGF